ncbi:long-chain fatty acid--CoA ligase [Mariniluteicoccus endophyticus]
MTNIAVWLTERAHEAPESIAVKQGEVSLTYAALDHLAGCVASLLQEKGVRAGDRVALTMPNVAYFPAIYYGILRLGAVVVPMNPLLKAREVAYTWNDAEVKLAVVFAMFAEEATAAAQETGTEVVVVTPGEFEREVGVRQPVSEVVDRDDDDTVVVFYTSGTTGQPKGAELMQRNIRSNVMTTLETLFDINPDDVVFGGLPLFHSFGQTCAMNACFAAGATLDLLPRFDGAEALQMIQDDKVTIFMGVPTMYMGLLNVPDKEKYDTSTLRLGVSGGASLPVEVLHAVEKTFNFRLLEGYGLSETSPAASFNHPDRPSKPGSVGQPLRGVEFCLMNMDGNIIEETDTIGEICVRGECVMKGYLTKPEATAEAMRGGWFHTGDLGTRDSDGFYYIVDRKKDMINRNGFNVYPREIEEIIGSSQSRVGSESAGLE